MDERVKLVKSEIVYEIEWHGGKYTVRDYYDSTDKQKCRFECFDKNNNPISDEGLVGKLFEMCDLHLRQLGDKTDYSKE